MIHWVKMIETGLRIRLQMGHRNLFAYAQLIINRNVIKTVPAKLRSKTLPI